MRGSAGAAPRSIPDRDPAGDGAGDGSRFGCIAGGLRQPTTFLAIRDEAYHSIAEPLLCHWQWSDAGTFGQQPLSSGTT